MDSQKKIYNWVKKIFSLNSDIKYLCIDVANGYREDFINSVKNYRETFPDKIIIAGNVATREMTEALILAGADIVKLELDQVLFVLQEA